MILFARALLFVLCALALPASAEQTSRIIVKFKEGSAKALMTREARSARLAEETGVAMAPLRTLAIGADVVALDHPVDTGVARTLAAKIAARVSPRADGFTQCGLVRSIEIVKACSKHGAKGCGSAIAHA